MNILKKIVLGTVLVAGMQVNAQKIAHINFEEVVAAMPETTKMKTELEKYGRTLETEIKGKQSSLESKIKRYQADQASVTPEINQQRAQEVQQEQLQLQKAQLQAQQELQKKQQALLNPIIEKAQSIVKEYTKTNGIAYVLDAKSVIIANGEDITTAIKTKLGVK